MASPETSGAHNLAGQHQYLRLPVELILTIFAIASPSSPLESREEACRVSLVCSWAREFLLPRIFHTIAIQTPPSGQTIIPATIGIHVRNLWMRYVGQYWRNIIPFFAACPNVVHLALPSQNFWALHESLERRYEKMNEGYLQSNPRPFSCRSIFVTDASNEAAWNLFEVFPAGLSFLRGITHLRIAKFQTTPYYPTGHLPNLTVLDLPHERFDHAFEVVQRLSKTIETSFPALRKLDLHQPFNEVQCHQIIQWFDELMVGQDMVIHTDSTTPPHTVTVWQPGEESVEEPSSDAIEHQR